MKNNSESKKLSKSDLDNQLKIKQFWKSEIGKFEFKKNICTLATVIFNMMTAVLNIAIFALLITAVVLIIEKVNSPSYDPKNSNLVVIIFLVSLSVVFSIGIIVCSFILISMRNKNKFNIYKRICNELHDLFINYDGNEVDEEIKKIIDKNLVFKKEKFLNSIKKFVTEDEVKWS